MENLKIYICTHTGFECPVSAPVYEVLDARDICGDVLPGSGLPGAYYSELATYRHVAASDVLPEYVGFCGYRKYFPFMDDVPDDLTERVDRCGFLAGAEMTQLPNVREYYRCNHRIQHLDIMDEVIGEVSPEFLDMFRNHVNGKKMYICNMFITSAERFREMTEFIFRILDKVTERIMGDVHVYRDASGRPRIRRSERFGGFLGERLVSAYIASYYPETEALGMKVTGRAVD